MPFLPQPSTFGLGLASRNIGMCLRWLVGKMLRFAMRVTRKNKIRNEYIRGTVKVEQLGMKMREYGHIMRRNQEYVARKMMEMEIPGKRKRRRPKRRFLDVVKEDMGKVGAQETDVEDRTVWRKMIRCGYP